jgi:hypothetical protein
MIVIVKDFLIVKVFMFWISFVWIDFMFTLCCKILKKKKTNSIIYNV